MLTKNNLDIFCLLADGRPLCCRVMRLPSSSLVFGFSNVGMDRCVHSEGTAMPLFEGQRLVREPSRQSGDSAGTWSACCTRTVAERERFFARFEPLSDLRKLEQFLFLRFARLNNS